MAKPKEGYHDLFAQIPDQLWKALADEADQQDETITEALIRILTERYPHVGGPDDPLPKRRRPGRPPKTK